MSEAYFLKLPNNTLVPATAEDHELLKKIKQGDPVKLTYTRPRNYQFLKKFMSLMHLAYDYWEPKDAEVPAYVSAHGVVPEKNFDRFRYDITILAGYYDATYRLNGDVRLEAKSISFGNMSEDEFEKLYSAVIDVILAKVCTQFTGDMLRDTVDMTMSYV